MGSIKSKLEYEERLHKFVGRRNEIETVKKILNEKSVVGIFGMKDIGKSRFLIQAVDHIPMEAVVYKDFEIDDVNDTVIQYCWLEEFYEKFGNEQELESLRTRFPDGKIQCAEGDKCVGLSCKALKDEKNAAVKCLMRVREETIILLDNIDQLILTQGIKDVFLKFIDMSCKHCHKVKIMVTSADTISKIDNFGSVKLDIIDNEAALDLLYNYVENKPECDENKPECDENEPECDVLNGENCAEEKSNDRRFNKNNDVFKPGKNELVIRRVINLCEGLPKAVLALGQVLKEDNGLFSPEDALQLLILSRLQVLSPGNVPPSDRLDELKETIDSLNATFTDFYRSSVEQMDGNSCPIDNVIAGRSESGARMKQLFVKPLINKGLMSHKDQRLVVHGVLQECVVMLTCADYSANAEETKDLLMKCIKENAKRSYLEIPEECLKDSRKLEAFITNLFEQNKEMSHDSTGGFDLAAGSQQHTYPSENGPLAMSFKDTSLAESFEKITVETDSESSRTNEETKFLPLNEKKFQKDTAMPGNARAVQSQLKIESFEETTIETESESRKAEEASKFLPLNEKTFQNDTAMPGDVMYGHSQLKTVKQGFVSVEKRRDQTEDVDERPYWSDVLGSLVCQPESE